ncbi:MAG: AI-2E family transporter [Ruminococcaceae bacterium]|nr:AI-2E family transporter [Oscillospiraceae bacterium]
MDKHSEKNRYFTTETKKKIITYVTVILVGIVAFFLLSKTDNLTGIFSLFSKILAPIVYGVAIAYLVNPLTEKIRKPLENFFTGKIKNKIRGKKLAKGISIFLSISFVIVLITILLWMIIPELYNSVIKLISSAPLQLKNLQDWYTKQMDAGAEWTVYVKNALDSGIESLNKWLNSGSLMNSLNSTFSYLFNGIVGILSVLINIVIGIIVAVYALIEKDKFICQSKKLIYALFNTERANSILETARHGHKIFGGFLSGKILDSLIVGIIAFVFMIVFKMPYPLLISVIIGVTNIIPFFGPFIGAIPSAFLILIVDSSKCFWFILFIFILQQIDGNIIGPRILGTTTGISEFWVTFSLLLFGGLFGFTGMVLGVPLFAVIYYIVRNIVNKRIREKGLPLNQEDYHNAKSIDPETLEIIPFTEDKTEPQKEVSEEPTKKDDN